MSWGSKSKTTIKTSKTEPVSTPPPATTDEAMTKATTLDAPILQGSKPADQSCGNCGYFISDGGVTLCQRYPPTTVIEQKMYPSVAYYWPMVKASDWCGEYLKAGA